MVAMAYEYCVMRSGEDDPHRGPWPLEGCLKWIGEWMEDGGKGSTFYIARREVGLWERITDDLH